MKKAGTNLGHCHICQKLVDALLIGKCTQTTCAKPMTVKNEALVIPDFLRNQDNLKEENSSELESSALLCVVGVAIKDRIGRIYQLPKPNRHHHVIKEMVKDGCTTPITGEQGFILNNGRFVGRIKAKFIAEKAGQLLDRASKLRKLFSECIW